MDNIDITIGNKLTINTGNYSSIQPSVSITIRDIPVDKVEDIRANMDNILSIFITDEIIKLSETMDTIKTVGIKNIIEKYENPEIKEKMESSLQNSLEAIKLIKDEVI